MMLPAAPAPPGAPIGDTGLAIVSVTHAARVSDGPRGRGLEPALTLAIVALLILAVLYLVLILVGIAGFSVVGLLQH